MKNTKILSKIWLSETESSIYLDLLQNWTSNIVEIATRTKLNRPLIYQKIPYLIETGLLSKTLKWKRNHYKAESPEYLKNLFDNLSKNFNSLIPELQELYDHRDILPTIQVIEGKKSIKQVFEDIVMTLNHWDVYYRYSSRSNFWDNFTNLSKYKEIRDKKQIQRMVITSEKRAKIRQKKLDREIVYIPAWYELFDQNIAKMIYGNKIAIIDYNTFTAFIIENKILASFEEKIFNTLYKFLKKLEENNEY